MKSVWLLTENDLDKNVSDIENTKYGYFMFFYEAYRSQELYDNDRMLETFERSGCSDLVAKLCERNCFCANSFSDFVREIQNRGGCVLISANFWVNVVERKPPYYEVKIQVKSNDTYSESFEFKHIPLTKEEAEAVEKAASQIFEWKTGKTLTQIRKEKKNEKKYID